VNFQNGLRQLLQQEDLNFLLTNRIPRIALTRLMGWWSQIRHPWVARASIAVWRLFSDLDLSEARAQHFASLHDCFIRELRPGARPIDPCPQRMTAPCDAIVGACGRIQAGQVFQAKGFPYTLRSLLGDSPACAHWTDALEGGRFITLRLTSSMYHRFHAPDDSQLEHVTYLSGDTWNVNPIALQRVEKLFCKNERALLLVENSTHKNVIAMVPVAAVLVASIRLHAIDTVLHLRYPGPHLIDCDSAFVKGEELGWFQHGSTIIMLTPPGYALAPGLANGQVVRMGQALMVKTA